MRPRIEADPAPLPGAFDAHTHTWSTPEFDEDYDATMARAWAAGLVGIVEVGVDTASSEQCLDLARERDLPVVIHSRDADEECFAILDEWARRVGRYLGAGREIGMMHCYAGDAALAARYLDIGFLISVPGTVTFPNNPQGQEVARAVPLAGMLIETDSPYLTPAPHRGRRNEPAYVVETARFVANLKGVSPEEVARTTAQNAARFFNLGTLG